MAPQTRRTRPADHREPPDQRGPELRLSIAAPPAAAARTLDADQQRVVDLQPGHGPVVVIGGPGTGRSTVAVEYAAARIEAGLVPDRLLMLAPTRQAAARLRDSLSVRLDRAGRGTRSATPVRTWAAYAFDLIRRARVDGFLPTVQRTPRLLSGAEQDTVIAELLETYASGERPGPDWPEDLAEAVRTHGFRHEVRELIDRTSEYGIEPGDLQQLGERHGRPEWDAAAVLLQDYRDRLDLGMAEAFDPAGLITTARRLLEEEPELLDQERRRLPVLVIDDLQEATPAVHALLRILGSGQDVVATADPDTVVQGFRGARPDLLRGYPGRLADPAHPGQTLVLRTGHRMGEDVLTAYRRITRRLPADVRTAELRQALTSVGDDQDQCSEPGPDRPTTSAPPAPSAPSVPRGVDVHLVASPAHEDQLVLQQVLELHHRHGVALQRIAVMARSGPLVAEIGRYLEAEGVPVDRAVTDSVLRTEPAVSPLLSLLRTVSAPADQPGHALDIDQALWLIGGRYGRSTALHVRQLRQRLLAAERDAGGSRSSNELLLDALEDPDRLEGLKAAGAGAQRIARMVRAGRTAAADPAATAETVLWALWDATGTPAQWQDLAVTGAGHAARRADHDLDAVVALFQAAERHVDQFAGSSPTAFAEFMEAQDLPMDTLAARARQDESVAVLTAAAAAGREWDAVIVAGLQDGIWPNTRLRGQLLGAADLAELVSGESGVLSRAAPAAYRTRVAEVRQDELRTFATAVSRARHRVVGVAVASAEQLPSDFLDLLSPWRDPSAPRPVTEVPASITAGALVARLRRHLEGAAHQAVHQALQRSGPDPDGGAAPDTVPDAAPETASPAAAALARLADEAVPWAGPDSWWGLLPLSTQEPLVDTQAERIPVSPSRVETALRSPLDWFLYQAGAQTATTRAQSLGTLIHAVAEALPHGPADRMLEELERRLPELDLEPGWETDLVLERARKMVRMFAQYLEDTRQQGRRLLAVELPFEADLDGEGVQVRVRGMIDRLEVRPDGRPYVVDLKTGAHQPSAAQIAEMPQLGAYQAAIAGGALAGALPPEAVEDLSRPTESGGAALAQLGTKNKNVKVQEQAGLGPEDTWALDQVLTAARSMVGPRFLARHEPGRPHCVVPGVCPLCTQGRQSTEWSR